MALGNHSGGLKDVLVSWRVQFVRSASSPLTMLAFVAMLLLSFASFRTTFAGMREDNLSYDLAFGFTFAVQTLLLFTSWEMAQMLTGQRHRSLPTFGVFAVAMGMSVMYSFIEFYTSAVPQDRRAGIYLSTARNDVLDVVGTLHDMNGQKRALLIQGVTGSDDFKAWELGLVAVANFAGESRRTLDQHFGRQVQEAREEVERREQALATARASSENASSIIQGKSSDRDALQRLVQTLRDQQASAQARLLQLEGEIVAKQGEMDAEEGGLVGGRPSGRGPKWRALRDQKRALEIQRDTQQRTLDGAQQRIGEGESQIAMLSEEIAQLENLGSGEGGSAAIASLQAELDTAQRRLRTLASTGGSTFDASDHARQLAAELDQFKQSFDVAAFNRADERCRTLLTGMREIPALSSNAVGLDCARSPTLAQSMEQVQQLHAASLRLSRACPRDGNINAERTGQPGQDAAGASGAATQASSSPIDIGGMNLDQLVAFGRQCIGLAGLSPTETRPLSERMTDIEKEGSPTASEITHVWNALSNEEEDAIYSLGRAFVLDLLILLAGLMGARAVRPEMGVDADRVQRALNINTSPQANDPSEVRKARAIIAWAVPRTVEAGDQRYEYQLDLAACADRAGQAGWPDIEDVRQTLGAFVESGRARIERESPDIVHLNRSAMGFLRDQVRGYEERVALYGRGQSSQDPSGVRTGQRPKVVAGTETRVKIKPGGLGMAPRLKSGTARRDVGGGADSSYSADRSTPQEPVAPEPAVFYDDETGPAVLVPTRTSEPEKSPASEPLAPDQKPEDASPRRKRRSGSKLRGTLFGKD